jgi:hypothetical protein
MWPEQIQPVEIGVAETVRIRVEKISGLVEAARPLNGMNKRETDGSSKPKPFVGRRLSGLHDACVANSSMNRSVSNEV